MILRLSLPISLFNHERHQTVAFHTGEYQFSVTSFECLHDIHFNVNQTVTMINWMYLRGRRNLCLSQNLVQDWFQYRHNTIRNYKAIIVSMMHKTLWLTYQ